MGFLALILRPMIKKDLVNKKRAYHLSNRNSGYQAYPTRRLDLPKMLQKQKMILYSTA